MYMQYYISRKIASNNIHREQYASPLPPPIKKNTTTKPHTDPDMTFAADWALKNKCVSMIYPSRSPNQTKPKAYLLQLLGQRLNLYTLLLLGRLQSFNGGMKVGDLPYT